VPDPAARGALDTVRTDYDAGSTVVGGGSSTTTFPEELKGSVHRPVGAGPFPVLLFLHGRHSTCAVVGQDALGSPCPDTPLTNSIDSYKGYDYLADTLASSGYVVMSVNANGTNSYDLSTTDAGANARSQIIAKSLDLLAAWDRAPGPTGIGDTLIGKLDLTRIGIMGHSRGGEGVADFIEYNRTRPPSAAGADGVVDSGPRYPGLKAVFSLAPIDRKNQQPHGVAFATLLPYCDGDVSDLSGSRAFERGKDRNSAEGFPTYQFGVTGTNHNFYNTVWTGGDVNPSGDDNKTTTDTACSLKDQPATSVRLSPPDQRRVGLALMAAFLRRHVGDETGFEPLLRGATRLPASGCPAGRALCPGLVQWSYIAPVSQRRVLVGPRPEGDAVVEATGSAVVTPCTPVNAGTGCPTSPNRSTTPQLTLTWDGPASLIARLACWLSRPGSAAVCGSRSP
jgi:dienelactone hydrolase